MDYSSTKDIIQATELLNESDAAWVDNNISVLQDNWAKKQMWRTETEMRVSVLNDSKFPTVASKYWQAVREQSVFYENLVQLSFDYRRNKIKIEKIQRKIDNCTDDLKLQSLAVDLEEAQFRQLGMKQAADDRMREIKLWAQIMDECLEADPNFDSENVDTHQFVSYMWRWHHQLQALGHSESSVSEVANLTGQYATALAAAARRKIELPLPIQQDAKRLGVPVYTQEALEDKTQNLSNVSFNLNGVKVQAS